MALKVGICGSAIPFQYAEAIECIGYPAAWLSGVILTEMTGRFGVIIGVSATIQA